MPQPGRLSAGLFNAAGFGPGPSKDGVTTRHARSAFTNRRRTAFHAAPGISRAFRQTIRAPAPSRRQRFPVYPWWDGKKYGTGFKGGDFAGMIFQ